MSLEEIIMRKPFLKLITLLCSGIIALLGLGACKSSKALEKEEQRKQNDQNVKPIDRDNGRVRLMYGVRPTPYSDKIHQENK